jgi:hypothetical protein
VVLALCLTVACQEQVEKAVQEEAQDSSFILKGTVAFEDDRPVADAEVMVYKADTSIYTWTFRMEVGEEGRVLNPRGMTDEEGHFEIEVERNFLPESEEIKLTTQWGGNQESPVTNDNGILVVLVASPGLKILDLDKLRGKIYLR